MVAALGGVLLAAAARACLPAAVRWALAVGAALAAAAAAAAGSSGASAAACAALAAELALSPADGLSGLLAAEGGLAAQLGLALRAVWGWAVARRCAAAIAAERFDFAPPLERDAAPDVAAAALEAPLLVLAQRGGGAWAAACRVHAARSLCAICEAPRCRRDVSGARRAALFEAGGSAWAKALSALSAPLDAYARSARAEAPEVVAWCGRALAAALVAARHEDRCGVVHLSGGVAPALAPLLRALVTAEARSGAGARHAAAADALMGATQRAASALGAREIAPLALSAAAWPEPGAADKGLPGAHLCARRLAACLSGDG